MSAKPTNPMRSVARKPPPEARSRNRWWELVAYQALLVGAFAWFVMVVITRPAGLPNHGAVAVMAATVAAQWRLSRSRRRGAAALQVAIAAGCFVLIPAALDLWFSPFIDADVGLPALLMGSWAGVLILTWTKAKGALSDRKILEIRLDAVVGLSAVLALSGVAACVAAVREPTTVSVDVIEQTCEGAKIPLEGGITVTASFDGDHEQTRSLKDGLASFEAPGYYLNATFQGSSQLRV